VGDTTDILEKQTYTFEDRGGDLLTLRAEGTAPVCRAYLQHGMHNLPQPVRLYYVSQGFRYERPQASRYRQFTQFGIEVIGEPDASVDAEVVEVGWRFLESVGLSDLSLTVNSIGDERCRPAYVNELASYYTGKRDRLCQDCVRRLERNPLRLLDCKEQSCQPLIAGAPHSTDHLCAECDAHWTEFMAHMAEVGLDYQVDHLLVRGLDYYTRTVFEIAPPVEGSTVTIVGGGRYDGLIESLGGKPTPGMGFGMGLERVIENLKRQEVPAPEEASIKSLVAHMGDPAKLVAVRIASELRRAGVASVVAPPGRGLRSQLRYANSTGCTHAVIIGDDELARGVATLRDLAKSQQTEVALDSLVKSLSDQA
jgi:histidyl-tRNA synthetase